MNDFEQLVCNWYFENVNTFTLETGILADFIKDLNLEGVSKKLFLKACNILHLFKKSIEKEMIEEEIERRKREK